VLQWNPAAQRLHGVAEPMVDPPLAKVLELMSRFELSTREGKVLAAHEWPMRRLLRGEVVRDLELRIRRVDIAWERVFSYGGARATDRSGDALAFLTVIDITGREQNAAALRASEERYRRIVETTQEGVWQIDAQGITTFVNRAHGADARLPRRRDAGCGRSLISWTMPAAPSLHTEEHGSERPVAAWPSSTTSASCAGTAATCGR